MAQTSCDREVSRRSVDNLKALYNVVVALALVEAVKSVLCSRPIPEP